MHPDASLFVYGTLRPEVNTRMSSFLDRASLHTEPARVAGVLYHLGRYPGMLSGGSGWVHGALVRLRDPEQTLKTLDDYEGDEFVRVRARALTRSGGFPCWVYVYSGSLRAARRIPSGDYLVSLTDNKSLDGSSYRPPRISSYGSLRYIRRSPL
jgi:gamma-glutamylcyclotransferase (GGCT)/AIG2-like uncharacterized protein YtfP